LIVNTFKITTKHFVIFVHLKLALLTKLSFVG